MTWARAPQQARSQKTLERLLDAAETILIDRGLDALTVPEVVRASSTSVGSFYARFPDKNALLETLHERACSETILTATAALDPARWEQASATAIVEATIGFSVQVFGARKSIMAAFARVFAQDQAFAARRARATLAVSELLTSLLLTHKKSIGHPHPERAIALAVRVVTATLEQRNALESSGVKDLSLDEDALIEELTLLVKGYLGIKP